VERDIMGTTRPKWWQVFRLFQLFQLVASRPGRTKRLQLLFPTSPYVARLGSEIRAYGIVGCVP
jgi:hypothetical protein